VFARQADGAWTLVAGNGRSTYARDHLGAMLGIAPPAIERLASPATCSDALCTWATPHGALVLVRTDAGFAAACHAGAIVIAKSSPPSQFASTCRPAALIDAADLARSCGGLIYDSNAGLRIVRAQPAGVRRPWTPRASADDQE
jgi:hypothetical protein